MRCRHANEDDSRQERAVPNGNQSEAAGPVSGFGPTNKPTKKKQGGQTSV